MKKLFLSLLFIVSSSAAADSLLKVIDQSGLVRAVSKISDKADIKVFVRNGAGHKLSIRNVDGFKGERVGKKTRNGAIIFYSVPSGVWKIAGKGQVAKVVISR
ncbi:MAG: hypothetical protein D6808_05260 [Candidatus Dadabacteria bacterium]|nr:MAG: hypothetical protein D6808_05260 [Candidatus Dadabacteria bacterium]